MQFGFSDILIVVYLVIAWSWNLPGESAAKLIVNKLSWFVQWLGLWHDWKMFAPNPPRYNNRIFVRVDYSDGTRREWSPAFDGRGRLVAGVSACPRAKVYGARVSRKAGDGARKFGVLHFGTLERPEFECAANERRNCQ
jgi:hypothetical protein